MPRLSAVVSLLTIAATFFCFSLPLHYCGWKPQPLQWIPLTDSIRNGLGKVARMTLAQIAVYLGFALGCLLGYLAWMQLLAVLRRRRFQTSEMLLNGRERLELEQTTIGALQELCRQDDRARQQFLAVYLERVPQVSDELRVHLRHSSELTDRFANNAVRQLDDVSLIGLAERLTCLSPGGSWNARRQHHQSLHRLWTPLQKVTAVAGLACLVLMLVFPPWVVRQQRRTRIIGGGESVQLIEQKACGYRWFGSRTAPPPVTTYRPTHDLRRLQSDESRSHIDYRHLSLQITLLVLLCSVAIWSVRRSHSQPFGSSRRSSRWTWDSLATS